MSGTYLVLNGRGEQTTYPPLYLLDYSGVCSILRERVFEKAIEFYENGASVREISRALDIPKTTLKDNLKRLSCQSGQKILPAKVFLGAAPYGFCIHKGELVMVEAEQKAVKIMMRYWQAGKSFRAIADVLNRQKIKTRKSKVWDHSVVRVILKRQMRVG